MRTLYVIFWCMGVASYLSSLVSSYLCVIFCALRLHAWPSCSVTANTQRPAFHYTIGLLQDSRNRIWNDVWWIRCRRRPLVGYVDWLVFGTWEKRTAKWLVDVKNLAAESGVIPRTLCLHLSECSGVLVRLFPVSAYRVYTGLLFPSTYRVSFKCPPTVCLSSVRLPCVFRVSAYRVSFECPPTFECPSVTSAYRTRALTVQCVSTYRVAHRSFLCSVTQAYCRVCICVWQWDLLCCTQEFFRCQFWWRLSESSPEGELNNGRLPPNLYVALSFRPWPCHEVC